MAYVITRLCRDRKDGACVDVCPVDCIVHHAPSSGESELPNQLFIRPDDCIDCGQCELACPFEAIQHEDDVPVAFESDIALNAVSEERPGEFSVPTDLTPGSPTPEEVLENKRRWQPPADEEPAVRRGG